MRAARLKYRIKGTDLYVRPAAASASAYEGASHSPRLARWVPPSAGPNSLFGGSMATLRARSRDLVRKDGLADNAVDTWVSNLVGTGIRPQFVTSDAGLNKALSGLFADWAAESDTTGQLSFYGQQALAVRAMAEGGEAFVRLRNRLPQDGLSVPLQIQVLESEYCPETKNDVGGGRGRRIRSGIEIDAVGRRVGYYLHREHPYDQTLVRGGDWEAKFVAATEVAHLTMAALRRPGMLRGEPWLTRALVKLKDLDKFDDAQLVRQQIAALFAGFVHSDLPDTEGDENEVFSGQEDPDGEGVALAALEPGTMQYLPPGRTVEFAEPPDPGNNYAAFIAQQERRVAVSVGALYEQVSGDYTKTNDRQFRAAVNEFRRRCQMLQRHLVIFQFCRPIMKRWASLAVLSGAIDLPGGISAADVARVRWVPQGWAYLNPLQDVQAKRAEVRAGFRSRADVVSERGDDVEETDREVADDNRRADEHGLVFDSDARKTAKGGADESGGDRGDNAPDKQGTDR